MDRSAVEAFIETVMTGVAPDIGPHDDVILVPQGIDMRDVEIYQEYRRRFRGTFETDDILAFGGYVIRSAQPVEQPPLVYVNAPEAVCYFDQGDAVHPGHCDHRAELTVTWTPFWKAMREIAGRWQTQRDLIEWLIDWNQELSGIDKDGATMTVEQIIAAVRRIDVQSSAKSTTNVDNMAESRSRFQQMRADNEEALPKQILFSQPAYFETDIVEGKMDVYLSLEEDNPPRIKLRLRSAEAVEDFVKASFEKAVSEACASKALTIKGRFQPR